MKPLRPRIRQLDVRDAPPEEPAARVIDALDRLATSEQLCVLTASEPFTLYRLLSNQSYAYCTRAIADTLFEVTIWRCGARAA